ncbi:MAG: lysylphosphatidylglycerol synthase transmembrane domain-containing protein [Spirochaeta sp.]
MSESVEQESAAGAFRRGFAMRRLVLFGILFAGLTALGIYAVYSQVAGSSFEWDSRLVSGRLLASTLGLLLVYFTADGLRLWFTLRALGHSVSLPGTIQLVFMNIFVSNITPLATGGGFVQVWFLRRHGVPVGTGLTATTIRTALAVLFIFGSAPMLLAFIPGAESAARSNAVLVPLLISVGLYLGFFALLILRPGWLLRPVQAILVLLKRLHLIRAERYERWMKRIEQELHRFSVGFGRYFRGRWYDILASILFTAVFLLSLFSFPALLLQALEYDFSYWQVIGRMLLTTFVMYFSPTPGASGIAEGVFGQFFGGMVAAGHIVLITIAWRVITIYLGMIIGLFMTQAELTRIGKEDAA